MPSRPVVADLLHDGDRDRRDGPTALPTIQMLERPAEREAHLSDRAAGPTGSSGGLREVALDLVGSPLRYERRQVSIRGERVPVSVHRGTPVEVDARPP